MQQGGSRRKEQFISTSAAENRCAGAQGRRKVKMIQRNSDYGFCFEMLKLKDFQRAALCDRIEAAQSRGADTVHWSRPVLWLPQWSNYHTSCYHILPITNASRLIFRLIFSLYISIRVWLIRHQATESKIHPIDFFLVYIFTHTHAIRSTFIDGFSTTGRPAVQPTPINLPFVRLPAGKTDKPDRKMDWEYFELQGKQVPSH